MEDIKIKDQNPHCSKHVLPAVVGSPKKYNIIYADPAWSIQTTSQVPSGRPNSRPYTNVHLTI